jgi:histidine decarboxylase
LATDGDTSHVICMPGITRGQIDAFVADIAATAPPRPIGPGSRPKRLSAPLGTEGAGLDHLPAI